MIIMTRKIVGQIERGEIKRPVPVDLLPGVLHEHALPENLASPAWGLVQAFRQFASDIRVADRGPMAPPSDTPFGRR
ncbi:hypothetical protein [Methylobacterium nonmethylotrophicum]|uniref:hypothetical protein n=1 Tax=Methylobacterium nonmethylotrophicum TaxID=1141884 RepID=UPI00107FDEE2|nr:hypothetical protein [Methylobacterium nonmethylotrophicum]